MMKMSGRVTSSCVALIFVLNSVSAVQKELRSIDDLKEINFGQSVPRHSLLLLYWFANTVDIGGNDIIRLTFDPNSGDYGSHYYGNFEELLVPLYRGSGYRYYTIGNIYQETSRPLPCYIVHPETEYEGRNSDRILIRAREENIDGQASQRTDQIYITQHVENQGEYDPYHTYRISMNLLRHIREFSVGENHQELLRLRNRYGSNADDSQLRRIRDSWGELAGLGLLLFIVIQERFTSNQQNRQSHSDDESESNVAADFKDHGASRTTGNTSNQQTNRPQYNYTAQSYRPGNMQNDEADAVMILCILVLILVILVIKLFQALGM